MKHLPPYWAIKIDKKHPLWERLRAEISEVSKVFQNEEDDWDYLFKTDDTYYNGYDMTNDINRHTECTIITLEQFFGETQYEIY